VRHLVVLRFNAVAISTERLSRKWQRQAKVPFRKCNALGHERQSLCTTPQCSTLEVSLKTGAYKATRPRIKSQTTRCMAREELTKKANAARDAAMVAAVQWAAGQIRSWQVMEQVALPKRLRILPAHWTGSACC